MAPKVGYLGPEGTFSEEALLSSAIPDSIQAVPRATIYDTIVALRRGEVEWAIAPIENSLDGSISVTLDLLADGVGDLRIVGETLLTVRHSLIAGRALRLEEIDTVITHPQVPGQCARFLRCELAHARVLPASSTAEAVREAVQHTEPGWAALGTRLAAAIYGGTVLRENVQDRDDNETRFVWLARATGETPAPPLRGHGGQVGDPGRDAGDVDADVDADVAEAGGWKTSLVFWGAGADSPGWLVRCLDEFARREINLTKIESRPRRERLGHYMFFVDLEAGADAESEQRVGDAIDGMRSICQEVRVLGSYPAA